MSTAGEQAYCIICPVCSHQSAAEATHCVSCWAHLAGTPPVTLEEGREFLRRRRQALRRRRLARWGVAAAVMLVLGGWVAYANIGATRFLPAPASDFTATPSFSDWPMYQRDSAHAAVVGDEGAPRLEGGLVRRFQTDGPIVSSPAVVDGVVYVTTGDRRVLALDARTGTVAWERRVTGPVDSSPAVAGDLVFVGLRDSRVMAFDRRTGETRWEFLAGGPVFSSPAAYKGVLYFGAGDGEIYALDAATGEKRWSYRTGGWVLSSPAVRDEVVVAISQDGYLYVIDTDTGKRRLDYRTATSAGGAAFDGNRVIVADEMGTVRAIDWTKREVPFEKAARQIRINLFVWGLVGSLPQAKGWVWTSYYPGDRFVGSPVVAGGTVYAATASGVLYALDEETGGEVWAFHADDRLTSSPSVAGDLVFVGDIDGRLYAVDAGTGERRWEFQAGDRISSTAVIAGGVLYVASYDGALYASE